jgi:hypothetical protein
MLKGSECVFVVWLFSSGVIGSFVVRYCGRDGYSCGDMLRLVVVALVLVVGRG